MGTAKNVFNKPTTMAQGQEHVSLTLKIYIQLYAMFDKNIQNANLNVLLTVQCL